MALDNFSNFALTTVTAVGSSTSLTVEDPSVLPEAPFNATIWPTGVSSLAGNSEIVRVTDKTGSVLTVTRAQESTSQVDVVVGYQLASTITAQTMEQIGADIAAVDAAVDALASVASSGDYADLSGTPSLGNASSRDVGTASGTVAAGDDVRIPPTPVGQTDGLVPKVSGGVWVLDEESGTDGEFIQGWNTSFTSTDLSGTIGGSYSSDTWTIMALQFTPLGSKVGSLSVDGGGEVTAESGIFEHTGGGTFSRYHTFTAADLGKFVGSGALGSFGRIASTDGQKIMAEFVYTGYAADDRFLNFTPNVPTDWPNIVPSTWRTALNDLADRVKGNSDLLSVLGDYAPGTSDDWPDTVPDDPSEALDLLAARTTDIEEQIPDQLSQVPWLGLVADDPVVIADHATLVANDLDAYMDGDGGFIKDDSGRLWMAHFKSDEESGFVPLSVDGRGWSFEEAVSVSMTSLPVGFDGSGGPIVDFGDGTGMMILHLEGSGIHKLAAGKVVMDASGPVSVTYLGDIITPEESQADALTEGTTLSQGTGDFLVTDIEGETYIRIPFLEWPDDGSFTSYFSLAKAALADIQLAVENDNPPYFFKWSGEDADTVVWTEDGIGGLGSEISLHGPRGGAPTLKMDDGRHLLVTADSDGGGNWRLEYSITSDGGLTWTDRSYLKVQGDLEWYTATAYSGDPDRPRDWVHPQFWVLTTQAGTPRWGTNEIAQFAVRPWVSGPAEETKLDTSLGIRKVYAGSNLSHPRPYDAGVVYWLFDNGTDPGEAGENITNAVFGDLWAVAAS